MARANAKLRLVVDRDRLATSASTPALDDSQLVAAARVGDALAARAIHDRLRPRVETTIYRLLRQRDPEHEDLVQTTMTELIRTIDRYRGECSLDTWASTIAAHVVYKHIRRRKTERRFFADSRDSVPEPVTTSTPSGSMMMRQLEERIQTHLEAVEQTKAWAYLLHDVFGFDLREVARITEVSVAAAQQRLVRGRRELHERIERDPELATWLMEVEAHE